MPIVSSFNITPAECRQDNGLIVLDSISGFGPFGYNWNTGDSTSNINNIASGEYLVTISDANKCLHLDTLTLSNIDEPIISVDINDNSCPDNQNGSVSITKVDGTAPPFFYSWSTGDSIRSIDSLAPGTYYLTVTYDEDCISINKYNIEQLSSISIDSSVVDEVCLDDNNGQIIVSVDAGLSPHSFNWDNGEMSSSIDNLASGNYNLTITDSLGCQYPYAYNIEEGGTVSATANILPTSCVMGDDGVIEIVPLGIPPFNYVWDNGATSQNNSNLIQGFYNLQLEDSLGCFENYNYEVISPPSIELTTSVIQPSCEMADSTGEIRLGPSGGTGLLDISWAFGSNDSIVNNLNPGNYIVTITDENFCELIDSFEIIEGNPLLSFGVIDSILCADGFGSINVEILSGSSPFSFLWNDGNVDSIRSNIIYGNYSVVVQDRFDCLDTLYFDLVTPPVITINTIQNITPTSAGNDGTIEIKPTSGSPPFVINWDNGDSAPITESWFWGFYSNHYGCEWVSRTDFFFF